MLFISQPDTNPLTAQRGRQGPCFLQPKLLQSELVIFPSKRAGWPSPSQ